MGGRRVVGASWLVLCCGRIDASATRDPMIWQSKKALWTPLVVRRWFAKIEESPIGYRLARGAFWSFIGASVSRGLQFTAFILVARVLGKDGFGELGIVQSTIGMFGTFAGFGLGLTATKFIAECRASDPRRAGRIRGLSSAAAWVTSLPATLFLLLAAPYLAQRILAAPHLEGSLRIGALLLLLTVVTGAQGGALAGLEAFRALAHVGFWTGIASFPLLACGAYLGGLNGALWALVITTGMNWFLNHLAVRRECLRTNIPYTYHSSWVERAILWRFSLPSVFAGAIAVPVIWSAHAMLVNQPNGYAEMGAYNAVMRVKQLPEMFLQMVMAPILPVLSDQLGRKALRDYRRTLTYALKFSILLIVPLSLLQMAIPSLTLLPYGVDYQGSASVVQWLMLHGVVLGIFWPMNQIVASADRMWIAGLYNALWAGAFLLLSFVLIPRYLATGLSASYALAYVTTGVPFMLYVRYRDAELIAGLPMFSTLATAVLAALVAGALGMLAPAMVAVPIAIGLLTVTILSWVLRGRLFKM